MVIKGDCIKIPAIKDEFFSENITLLDQPIRDLISKTIAHDSTLLRHILEIPKSVRIFLKKIVLKLTLLPFYIKACNSISCHEKKKSVWMNFQICFFFGVCFSWFNFKKHVLTL